MVVLVVVAGVELIGAGSQYGAPQQQTPQYADDNAAPAYYNFHWDVNDSPSGNFYAHGEDRDGANTQGT